ncbi:MAG: DNA mismatch repair protein MutS [Dehalococcoidia bacterium]|nr:DNA mismatch repair protein MutS [Dehalococcoidia bacterium]
MATPARQQFLDLKAQHPDALLLFRMGDFYETFDEDAETAARVLGIALTSRPMGKDEGRVPLAGIPYHQLDRYLDQLVAAGYRVAIGEQVSLPPSKGGEPGLVARRVTRVVTPGTVDRGELLTDRGHNWLLAVCAAPERRWAMAACDVTTGELELQVVDADALPGEWARIHPREAIVPEGVELPPLPPSLGDTMRTLRPARLFRPDRGRDALCERLQVASLDGFGLEGLDPAVGAAGALVGYLEEMWPQALAHLRVPRAVRGNEVVYLDPQTRRNLELFDGGRAGSGSLVETLDRTLTPMGARLLRLRLGRPLRRAADADARLDEVAAFVEATLPREALRNALRNMADLERLLGRLRAGTAHARHLVQLRRGLERLPEAREAAGRAGDAAQRAATGLAGADEIAAAIAACLDDDAPAEIGETPTVREGFDAEVDRLRGLTTNARGALADLERTERERTGIGTLKVGYNRVFGYYLECPRGQADKAPPEYEARQTLANAQRFRYGPLSDLEAEILGAKDALADAERGVVERLCAQVVAAGPAIERAAEAVARLDVAAALAVVAVDHAYVRPELHEGGPIEIEAGRHPVVERQLRRGEFVANDTFLGASGDGSGEGGHADLVVLTGPNMAGKSTYLRQTALIVLLAQCGSFVPASRARIAMADRIFSRVGAQDDIVAGQSTFMVEMLETATILHNATERSLVILDEVGRGTSTYDGLAIARAVIEYLHHRPGGTPRTLFATHYHELTELASRLPRIANRSVAVREERGEVVFLHRIVDGGTDRSYGVHVAALAGLPRAVVSRARELLADLEAGAAAARLAGSGREPDAQMSLLGAEDEAVLRALADLDPDALSPLEALQTLYDLRAQARRRLAIEG